MKHSNLTKNTLLLSIGIILNKGISFLMIPLFSSWLLTKDYGTFDLLCTYVAMLIPILSLAVGNGVFRFGIESTEKKKKAYITSGFIIFLIGISIFGILSSIFYLIFKNPIIVPFYMMLIGEIFNEFLQYFLRTIKKLNIYSFCSAFSTLCTFIFVTIFIKMFNLGLYGIIYGYACGFLFGDIIIVIYTKFHSYLTKDFKLKDIKELIKYSLPLIPNSISWWIVNASDRTIINIFIGSIANGIYAIAYKIPNLCSNVFNSFSIAWQETAIDIKTHEKRNTYYSNVYNKIILIILSLCTGVLSCNFILFDYIFDIKYINAHYYTPILVTSIIFNSISQYFGGIQISFKKSKANGITTIIGAIVNVVVHLLLVKFIGLYAAAISTLLSTIIIVIMRKIMLENKVKVKLEKKNYKYILIYLYITVCAFEYQKIPFIINIFNLLIATIIFIIINKDFIFKIFKKFGVVKKFKKSKVNYNS